MTAEDTSGPDDAGVDGASDASATDGEDGPECPFCGSTDTELESAFGSEVSKTQYYCNGCTTVFERLKFDGDLPDTGR